MKNVWNKFTAWLSGWPKSTTQGQKIKKDDELFAEAEAKFKATPKLKKPKGLNPKKKKRKSKGKRQGNLT